MPRRSIIGIAAASSSLAAARIVWVCCGRLRHRVRPSGSREVAEAQPQRDRAADPPGCAQPAGEPVDEADEDDVERLP